MLLYAVFVTSALCYLILTWANSHVSSIMVTAFWPVQVRERGREREERERGERENSCYTTIGPGSHHSVVVPCW